MMQLMTVVVRHQKKQVATKSRSYSGLLGRAGASGRPVTLWVRLKDASWIWHVEIRECRVTYVVMEGLCLAGVLARLPSVWSGAIQIPEHAGMERGEVGSGEVKGLASGTQGANVQQLFITNRALWLSL